MNEEKPIEVLLPNVVVAIAAIPLVLFLIFLTGRILAPSTHHPMVAVSDVKPDVTYRQLPPAGAAPQSAAADQPILYFAPISATLPVLVSTVEPEYTAEARQAGVHGVVTMKIKINPGGNVSDPQVLSGLGDDLDVRALRAVINWRFQPAKVDGKPVASTAHVDVHFK